MITNNDADAEYSYVLDDNIVWFIDFRIGIAFETPIDFNDLINSKRRYKEFTDYKDFQDYLEKIVGQEIVLESTINPVSKKEIKRRILWRSIML